MVKWGDGELDVVAGNPQPGFLWSVFDLFTGGDDPKHDCIMKRCRSLEGKALSMISSEDFRVRILHKPKALCVGVERIEISRWNIWYHMTAIMANGNCYETYIFYTEIESPYSYLAAYTRTETEESDDGAVDFRCYEMRG